MSWSPSLLVEKSSDSMSFSRMSTIEAFSTGNSELRRQHVCQCCSPTTVVKEVYLIRKVALALPPICSWARKMTELPSSACLTVSSKTFDAPSTTKGNSMEESFPPLLMCLTAEVKVQCHETGGARGNLHRIGVLKAYATSATSL